MGRCSGPFPHVAEALIVLFTDAVARCGVCTAGLELDKPHTTQADTQWRTFIEHGDSIAFISWCADIIRYWNTPEYMQLQRQAPLYGTMDEPFSFVILSPDGKTDWTLAAWHIHADTESTLPFTEDVMQKMEATLAT